MAATTAGFKREPTPSFSDHRRRLGKSAVLPSRRAVLGSWRATLVFAPKWRNWQTRRTQNPVGREARVGSTPTFGICEGRRAHGRRRLPRPECGYPGGGSAVLFAWARGA